MTAVELGSAIGLALNTVREHKMRSFLTVLGVIIGTGTIIGVGSIIAGLDGAVTNVLKSFGTNTAIVFKFPFLSAVTDEEVRRKSLNYEDAVAIAERCPSVLHVSPYLFPNTFGTGPQINIARYKGQELYQPDIGGTEESYVAGGSAEPAVPKAHDQRGDGGGDRRGIQCAHCGHHVHTRRADREPGPDDAIGRDCCGGAGGGSGAQDHGHESCVPCAAAL